MPFSGQETAKKDFFYILINVETLFSRLHAQKFPRTLSGYVHVVWSIIGHDVSLQVTKQHIIFGELQAVGNLICHPKRM